MRIGTRGSPLALAQTDIFIKTAKKHYPDEKYEVIKITTSGDKIKDVRFEKGFYKGFFTRELETALLENKIDAAVHSLKDLPAKTANGLTLSCFLKRGSTNDYFITRKGHSINNVITVGTASLRRKYFLSLNYPQLKVKSIKGNVNTRLDKLNKGEFDAICLARAGIDRLKIDLTKYTVVELSHKQLPPSPCQGIIAIQTRDKDELTNKLKIVSDETTLLEASIERHFLNCIGADCNYPLAAISKVDDNHVTFEYWLKGENGVIHDCITSTINKILKEIEEISAKYKPLLARLTANNYGL